MYAGLAAGLLVFAGFWRATEWMMDGRRQDTWRLVPVGLVYLLLGMLLVSGVGGTITHGITAIFVAALGTVTFMRRDQTKIRKWVTWSFVIVDVVVVVALLAAWLS